jgi:hypothetical protein
MRGTLGIGVAISLIAVTSAQAQDKRHVGVEGQVQVLHDSNVSRSNSAVAAARGVDLSDTITTPSLVVDILLPVSRQSLFLVGSAGRQYYQKNDELNSAHYDLTGGARLHASLCQGTLSGAYLYGQSDLRDLTLAATRNVEEARTGTLEVSCGRSAGLAPNFRVSDTKVENSALILSDSHTTSTSAGLAYRRPSFGELSVFGQHSKTEYPHRLVLVGTGLGQDGFETDSAGVSFTRRLGARIGGEVSVSYQSVKPEASNLSDFKGVSYSALIDYRVSSRLQTSLQLRRGAEPTIIPGAAYTIDQTIQLSATYAVGSRLNLNAGILRTEDRYKGSGFGVTDLTQDNLNAIYGGARWDFGRRTALAASLRHEERDANVPGFDYSSTQAGVTLIGKF